MSQDLTNAISEIGVLIIVSLWALISGKLKNKKHKNEIASLQEQYAIGDCQGKPAFCQSRIVRKSMQIYDRIANAVIAESGESYIKDLENGIANGQIAIDLDEKDRIISKHKDILQSAFLHGRFYIHDTIIADDFPVSYVKRDGIDVVNTEFLTLCENILDGYYAVVWDTYGEMYYPSFYKMDYQKRRAEFTKNKPKHLKILIDMMIQINKLMGKER